jgi:uncharacterized protein YkwD
MLANTLDFTHPGVGAWHRTRWLFSVAAIAALAACGGGGSDAPASDTASPPGIAAAPSPAASSNTVSKPCTASGEQAFRDEVLQRVNAYRAAGATCGARGAFAATGSLAWNAQLEQAALGFSREMQQSNPDRLSHTGPTGSTIASRISGTGYAWSRVAENIAAGYDPAQEVVDAWMGSDGHCANIMNPQLRDIGVACVPGTASNKYGTYWAMDFGTPR